MDKAKIEALAMQLATLANQLHAKPETYNENDRMHRIAMLLANHTDELRERRKASHLRLVK